jgi:hypothetical protein
MARRPPPQLPPPRSKEAEEEQLPSPTPKKTKKHVSQLPMVKGEIGKSGATIQPPRNAAAPVQQSTTAQQPQQQ